jgi:OFA family oxalate/formate antiporter-like MFS transporter
MAEQTAAVPAVSHSTRWIVAVGGILVQLCLGAIYAWSVFVNPLIAGFGYNNAQAQAVFSVGLAAFAVTTILAGRWQDRGGPRTVALTGAIVLGVGYVLAGVTGGSVLAVTLTAGLIGGIGIGIGYVCPIAALVKWFPDMRGFITGIAVAGFGGGAYIFSKLGGRLLPEITLAEQAGKKVPVIPEGIAQAAFQHQVLQTFLVFGVVFAIIAGIGALLLKDPPAGWLPAGWTPPARRSREHFAPREMLRTGQFYMLWICFAGAAMAGLLTIGVLKPFGQWSGLGKPPGSAEAAAAATTAVGVLALFNAAGRIFWGWFSDRVGRRYAMMIMFALQGAMMLYLINMGNSILQLEIAAAWIGFNFGGNFALFPSATADFYGTLNLGVNYGLVFTSYGVAGIIGPLMAGRVFDTLGSYEPAFIAAGIACLAAAVIAFFIKAPKHELAA